MDLPGYRGVEEIYQGSKYKVFSAQKADTDQSVIIKTLPSAHPSHQENLRLKQEHEFSEALADDGVIKTIQLENLNNKYYLVMEDFGGISLQKHLNDKPMTVGEFLPLAVSLSRTLKVIHSKQIIHKDLKPSNIIIAGETIKITDFGIATHLSKETQGYVTTNALEGSLAYISPEQTGRMNRSIDSRTDLYSLGVTFFQMLTGRLPFNESDPLKMVHSHIAILPDRVDNIEAKVPQALADIIEKLLSKNVEDRYQSAAGLNNDLETCWQQWQANGKIENFSIAKADSSGQFEIQQKLYGRDEEVTQILAGFKRVAGSACEVFLVGGYSGVGKTALIHEMHKPITAKHGFFISGKYDQFQRDIPYFAIGQAFNELCDYLLEESPEILEDWKNRFKEVLGEEAQAILEIVPRLELILGEQPELPEVSLAESQNRLFRVMTAFIKVLCSQKHPLTVFIDDMQWADSGSLSLLQHLVEVPDLCFFLLICAYRDNEVDPHHPFLLTVENVRKAGVPTHEINLQPLKQNDITDLLGDSLLAEAQTVQELSKLTYSKTQGNAFFTNQFLYSLYDEHFLQYNHEDQAWQWDVDKIQARNITDNVVELMTAKIARLPAKTQEMLQFAACIGNQFSLRFLSIIASESREDILGHIWPAIEEGLVYPTDQNYKLLRSKGNDEMLSDEEQAKLDSKFKFIHDRVQQSSYLSIDSAKTAEIHLQIGRLLYENTSQENLSEQVFSILNQYEKSLSLLESDQERIEVAELCRLGAKRAMQSSAFASGLHYADLAIQNLLTKDSWESNYDLTVELYLTLANCQYSAVKLEESEITCREALTHAKGEKEIVDFYKILSHILFNLNRHHEGLQNSRDCFNYLGVKIPKKVTKVHVALLYAQMRLRMKFRGPEKYLHYKKLNKDRQFNILRMGYDSVESAFMVDPNFMGYVLMMMANISLKHGYSIYTAFSYAMTSLLQCGVTLELNMANRFCKAALEINKEYPNIDVKGRVNMAFGTFPYSWTNPMAGFEPYIKLALQCFQASGNNHWATYSHFFCSPHMIWFNRKSLEEVIEEHETNYLLYSKNRDEEVSLQQNHFLNYLYNLQGRTEIYQSEVYPFDKDEYEARMRQPGNFLMRIYYHTTNMMQYFMEDNYQKAFDSGWTTMKMLIEAMGNLMQLNSHMFYALSYFKVEKGLSRFEKLKHAIPMKITRFRLKYHAKKYPDSYLPYHELLEAEYARIEKKFEKAENLYEKAINSAKKASFSFVTALCYEVAGQYYMQREKSFVAHAHLREAYQAYLGWGAVWKAKLMQEKYPEAFANQAQFSALSTSQGKAGSAESGAPGSQYADNLDLYSILNASQALSGEIVFERLLEKLIQILQETAGAERTVILANENEELFLRAEGRHGQEVVFWEEKKNVETVSDMLPVSLVHYVARTKENLVLSNASEERNYKHNPYIQKNKVLSVLSVPIVSKGNLIAVIYMENSVSTGAFTQERLDVLQTLSSQVAISMENSILYDSLEAKVRQRTQDLNKALEETMQLKRQQDGDYFLFSLLTKPLFQTDLDNDAVTITSVVQQKKTFSFKENDHEIGGDINICHTLTFNEKTYTVYVNADAMGKSTQGAGGVLVFGTAFDVLIERLKKNSKSSDFAPEKWLATAFRELNRIFLSFEGSMLMSFVFGIIENKTGITHFINAEHPSTVLYRDKNASFVEKEFTHYKIGTPLLEDLHSVNIQKIRLHPGDILLMGSDGKDDLDLGDRINEDETLFLRITEEANADLESITNKLKETGSLKDDLSLLRVEYKGQ